MGALRRGVLGVLGAGLLSRPPTARSAACHLAGVAGFLPKVVDLAEVVAAGDRERADLAAADLLGAAVASELSGPEMAHTAAQRC
jgi:hypothetical protein